MTKPTGASKVNSIATFKCNGASDTNLCQKGTNQTTAGTNSLIEGGIKCMTVDWTLSGDAAYKKTTYTDGYKIASKMSMTAKGGHSMANQQGGACVYAGTENILCHEVKSSTTNATAAKVAVNEMCYVVAGKDGWDLIKTTTQATSWGKVDKCTAVSADAAKGGAAAPKVDDTAGLGASKDLTAGYFQPLWLAKGKYTAGPRISDQVSVTANCISSFVNRLAGTQTGFTSTDAATKISAAIQGSTVTAKWLNASSLAAGAAVAFGAAALSF